MRDMSGCGSEALGKPEKNDRVSELKAFDDSKAGVKGLVDAGIAKVPRIFIQEERKFEEKLRSGKFNFSLPVIDFDGIEESANRRCEVIDKVKDASEKWGIFQIVNHGIPADVMDEMINAVCKFHEQDTEVKKQFYSRDRTKGFKFNSNFLLYEAPVANWADTLEYTIAPDPPKAEEIPDIVRDILLKYSKYVAQLGVALFDLLSEALGLKRNHLKDMSCTEGLFLLGHYYPPCPEAELTLGSSKHTDGPFLTVLLQNQICGLQVLHENQWVDVPFLPGALIVNISDLLQLVTNDKFKSVYHRVLAQKEGPRISIACFFRPNFYEVIPSRLYGPIKELLSEENPPI